MKPGSDIVTAYDFFTIKKSNHTVVIRFNECPFYSGMDLDAKNDLLECLNQISMDEDVKAVLLIGSSSQKGIEKF